MNNETKHTIEPTDFHGTEAYSVFCDGVRRETFNYKRQAEAFVAAIEQGKDYAAAVNLAMGA